jgi:hypothetical protein
MALQREQGWCVQDISLELMARQSDSAQQHLQSPLRVSCFA